MRWILCPITMIGTATVVDTSILEYLLKCRIKLDEKHSTEFTIGYMTYPVRIPAALISHHTMQYLGSYMCGKQQETTIAYPICGHYGLTMSTHNDLFWYLGHTQWGLTAVLVLWQSPSSQYFYFLYLSTTVSAESLLFR